MPAAARLGLPAPVTAALVAPVADTMSRIVLLWVQSRLPPDVVGALESGAFDRFTLLAPVLDAQVQAEEAASRLRAVVSALDQAVVLTATGSGPASVNDAAAQLLGLPPGSVDTEVLSDAMRSLRDRAVDPAGLTAEADRLLATSTAVVRDWVWALRGMPSHLRVTSLPVDTVTGPGRVWVFDDISAEMGLVESERRTGRALAESEQRYRRLAENVSDVVVQGSNEGVITWVSPSVTTTMGWTPDDLVGRTFRDLVHPADRGEVDAGQERLARGERASLEVRLLTAGGAHRWMNIRVKPVLDAAGRMVGRIAGWWDAQASHEAIEQLARSESRYRMLLENSNDVVFQASDGVLAWVSPTVETVTGWPTEELVGRTTAHLWHPDDVARAAELREDAQGGAHVRDVLRFRHADGNHLWMEVTARPFSEPAGRPGVVGMMHDVTDRVLAQEAERASEERYRLVAENASDVVCRYDAAGIIDWVFGSTEALAGRSAAELVGTPALAVFMAEDLADRDEIRAQLVRGEAVQRLARLRRPDGSTRWVEARAKALVATDGSIEYVISTWRDAQAEVEYRDALAGSERQARELADAYRAARNEAIEASTAKTGVPLADEPRAADTAERGARFRPAPRARPPHGRAGRGGGAHPHRRPTPARPDQRDPRHLADRGGEALAVDGAGRRRGRLAEAIDLVRPLARQYGVSLDVTDSGGLAVRVHADRQRVRQVLLNLLSNAVKYNRPDGSVRVTCRCGQPGRGRLRGVRHRPGDRRRAAAAAVPAVRPAGRREQRRRGHGHRADPGRRRSPGPWAGAST